MNIFLSLGTGYLTDFTQYGGINHLLAKFAVDMWGSCQTWVEGGNRHLLVGNLILGCCSVTKSLNLHNKKWNGGSMDVTEDYSHEKILGRAYG